jgi:hypothetical protein
MSAASLPMKSRGSKNTCVRALRTWSVATCPTSKDCCGMIKVIRDSLFSQFYCWRKPVMDRFDRHHQDDYFMTGIVTQYWFTRSPNSDESWCQNENGQPTTDRYTPRLIQIPIALWHFVLPWYAPRFRPWWPVRRPYERHRPEKIRLYRFIDRDYPALRAYLAEQGRPLPFHVPKEFDQYLKCGRLAQVFLRVQCIPATINGGLRSAVKTMLRCQTHG